MSAPRQQPSTPTTGGSPAPARSRGKSTRNVSVGQILGGILLVLVVIFIAENTRDVPIRFIAGPEVEVPVYLALLIAAVVGGLVGSLLRYRRTRHHGGK